MSPEVTCYHQAVTLLTLLGSTGSIGTSTLDVVRRWPGRFGIYALVAGRNVELLARQIAEFQPQVAVVADEAALDRTSRDSEGIGTRRAGTGESVPQARVAAATAPEAGFVMSAIVGVEGLEATYEAVRLGKRIGLANKEVLVAGGKLVIEAMRASGAELIPVDSEHNGAHQCFRGRAAQRGRQADPDRFRRTVPRDPGRRAGAGDSGAGLESSNLEDGPAHHHRFGHADEQGI